MKCSKCGYETESMTMFHDHLYSHVAEEQNSEAYREAYVGTMRAMGPGNESFARAAGEAALKKEKEG